MKTEKRLADIGERVVITFAVPLTKDGYMNDDVGECLSSPSDFGSYIRIERTGKIHIIAYNEYRVILEDSEPDSEAYIIYAPNRPILLTPSKHVAGMYFNHDAGDLYTKEQVDYLIDRFAKFGCATIPVSVKEVYLIE